MQKANPDIYRPLDVPNRLKPYVRRALVADTDEIIDMMVDVRATGYHYFGWVWRGRWQGIVNGEIRFDSDRDGALHLSGQVVKSEIFARMQRDVGQIFLEFTAVGHFQLLGITGARLLEHARAPHVMNPALMPHLEKLLHAESGTPSERMEILADVLSQLPKHPVPERIIAVVQHIEAANGVVKISDLAEQFGLAERQFRTDFKVLIGITPKSFCKTLQINQALNHLLTNGSGNLADIAAQTGFSDQAHFTRAFSAFLGNTPRDCLGNLEKTLARFVGQSRQ